MLDKNFLTLPMTSLEYQLKTCLQARPDMRDHIPSSDELTEFIVWMAENYGHSSDMTLAQLPVQPCSEEFSDIATALLSDPFDTAALSKMSSGYTNHSEDLFFPVGQDISVSRQLRYMPSHWHSNSYFEIYYVPSGTCPVYFPEEVIRLHAGDILVVAPNAVHASPCYEDDSILLFYMLRASTFHQTFWNQLPTDSLMSKFFRQILEGQNPTAYLHFETKQDPDVQRLLLQIYSESRNGETYQNQMLNALMSTFFILLLRRYESSVKLPRTKDFFWKREFSAILSHIQTNYSNVTLQELSEKYHYSQRQISRIVQNCMGLTYHQLILKLRMEKAALLLVQNIASIANIAQSVGYASTSSFYRAFTAYYGCTPKEYITK